jgi:hypothetical protein
MVCRRHHKPTIIGLGVAHARRGRLALEQLGLGVQLDGIGDFDLQAIIDPIVRTFDHPLLSIFWRMVDPTQLFYFATRPYGINDVTALDQADIEDGMIVV